jgi:aminoglycoside 3-N-acetyltransferase
LIGKRQLVEQLLEVGVEPAGVLVVHTAFSRVAPIEDGPRGLIEALLETLGPAGTLVMPSMSDDDDHPFDPRSTPCRGMGIVAETFWRMPLVQRSDSPHAFAACGAQALLITAAHPISVPHGLDSPVGRAYELDGQILLLGVGHDANTTVHLAENLMRARYLRPKHATVAIAGNPTRIEYEELDHCCERFAQLDQWLEHEGAQRGGLVGHAPARLMRARDVVRIASSRLAQSETIFLHDRGACEECDEAHASLELTRSACAAS